MQKLMWNKVLPLACMTADSLATAWHQHFHSFTTDCLYAYKSTQLAGLCAFGNVYSVLYSISLMWKVENSFTSCTEVGWKESNTWNGLHGIIFIAQVEMFPQFHRFAATSVYNEGINWDKIANIQLSGVIMWLSNSETSWHKRLRHLLKIEANSKVNFQTEIRWFWQSTILWQWWCVGCKEIRNMGEFSICAASPWVWARSNIYDTRNQHSTVVISVMVSKMTEWFNFL